MIPFITVGNIQHSISEIGKKHEVNIYFSGELYEQMVEETCEPGSSLI
jgi:hypothetical protein